MLGQFVPKGGFKMGDNRKQMTFKSMKTEKLIEEREQELLQMNDSEQMNISKELIQQFNQIKKLLHCFTYSVNDRKILCTSIIIHIMNEMRQDRKIKMILKDRGIEDYVRMDITDIDLDDPDVLDSDLSEEALFTLREKLDFRRRMADKASIIKLNYYSRMMQNVFGKVQLPHPDSYSDKLKQLSKEQQLKAKGNSGGDGLARAKTDLSFFSMVSSKKMS
mmetsp:Transcript_12337/g.19157  ORF Transcript_12337/g.19157 Transcript_12337/m.19157 type:complete len:220 (-) Transcript_12337:18-677(-)